MRFYEVTGPVSPTEYADAVTHGTLAEARADVRGRVKAKADWRDIGIDEVEVSLDKLNVLRLINGSGGTHEFIRHWGATPRGGIKLEPREEP